MKIPCSNCGQRLEIPEELAGQTIECPACKASLAVPALEPTPPATLQIRVATPQATATQKPALRRKNKRTRMTVKAKTGTLTLKPKRGGRGGVPLWATLLFALGVLIGFLMLSDPDEVLVGWLIIIFCGSILAWGEVVLTPGAYYIQLTKDNFIQCKFWRIETVSWKDIERFDIILSSDLKVLGYVFTDEYKNSDNYKKDSLMVKLRELMQKVDGSIQVNCGKTAEELCHFLNEKLDEWRWNNPQ